MRKAKNKKRKVSILLISGRNMHYVVGREGQGQPQGKMIRYKWMKGSHTVVCPDSYNYYRYKGRDCVVVEEGKAEAIDIATGQGTIPSELVDEMIYNEVIVKTIKAVSSSKINMKMIIIIIAVIAVAVMGYMLIQGGKKPVAVEEVVMLINCMGIM